MRLPSDVDEEIGALEAIELRLKSFEYSPQLTMLVSRGRLAARDVAHAVRQDAKKPIEQGGRAPKLDAQRVAGDFEHITR